MVIDTSALIAILLYEPETEPFAKAIAANPKRLISVFNLLELNQVKNLVKMKETCLARKKALAVRFSNRLNKSFHHRLSLSRNDVFVRQGSFPHKRLVDLMQKLQGTTNNTGACRMTSRLS